MVALPIHVVGSRHRIELPEKGHPPASGRSVDRSRPAFGRGTRGGTLLALADRIFRYPLPGSPTSRFRPSDALLARRQRALKRIFDVSLASMTLLVLSPLMLLIAILVSISSPGPVIYRHRRVGQGGRGIRRPQVPDDVRIGRRGGVADHRRGRPPDHTASAGGCAAPSSTSSPNCGTSSAGRCPWSAGGRTWRATRTA